MFISHLHSDHVLDLVTLLQASNATPGWKREDPLELYGCRGLATLVSQVMAAFDGTTPEGFPLRIAELGEERHDLGGFTVETALTAPHRDQPGVPHRSRRSNGRLFGRRDRDPGARATRAGGRRLRLRMLLPARLADGRPCHRRRRGPPGPVGRRTTAGALAPLPARAGSGRRRAGASRVRGGSDPGGRRHRGGLGGDGDGIAAGATASPPVARDGSGAGAILPVRAGLRGGAGAGPPPRRACSSTACRVSTASAGLSRRSWSRRSGTAFSSRSRPPCSA